VAYIQKFRADLFWITSSSSATSATTDSLGIKHIQQSRWRRQHYARRNKEKHQKSYRKIDQAEVDLKTN
jgi:hypothetical protein